MQKNAYKTPLTTAQKATGKYAGDPRVKAGGADVMAFVNVSKARHLDLRQWLAEWNQKPPP